VNWPVGPTLFVLQKQQSTGVAKAVLPPVTFRHEHVVVRDPARAAETPHVAVWAGQGVSVHLWVYVTHGHVGWVGAGVGWRQPDLPYWHRKPGLPPGVGSMVVKTDLNSAKPVTDSPERPRNRTTAFQIWLSL